MRLVHDVVASLQLQRVDDVLAPAGELLDLAGVVSGRAAEELALADQRDPRLRLLEARVDAALHEVGDAGLRLVGERVGDAPGELAVGEHIAAALDQSLARGDHGDRPAGGEQLSDVVESALGVALVRGHGLAANALIAVGCALDAGLVIELAVLGIVGP